MDSAPNVKWILKFCTFTFHIYFSLIFSYSCSRFFARLICTIFVDSYCVHSVFICAIRFSNPLDLSLHKHNEMNELYTQFVSALSNFSCFCTLSSTAISCYKHTHIYYIFFGIMFCWLLLSNSNETMAGRVCGPVSTAGVWHFHTCKSPTWCERDKTIHTHSSSLSLSHFSTRIFRRIYICVWAVYDCDSFAFEKFSKTFHHKQMSPAETEIR